MSLKRGERRIFLPFYLTGWKRRGCTARREPAPEGEDPVYRDYDVDGLTSVALLLRTLRRYNSGNIIYYLPKRLEDGYGLHLAALKKAVNYGCTTVVTVDCGISAHAEADYLSGARGKTDHN